MGLELMRVIRISQAARNELQENKWFRLVIAGRLDCLFPRVRLRRHWTMILSTCTPERLYMALLDSTTLYHGSTWLYNTMEKIFIIIGLVMHFPTLVRDQASRNISQPRTELFCCPLYVFTTLQHSNVLS